ncbi:MAG: carbohydrate ABC transporter permease [Caldilineaceae bacterium]|nr:carbohydrate ABC transporter permease [Caldilineaceae bacterium]
MAQMQTQLELNRSAVVINRRGLGYNLQRLWHTGDWYRYFLLSAIAFLMFLPFIVTFIISFKSLPQFNHDAFLPTFPLYPENYLDAWKVVSKYILNSIIVSGVSVVLMVALAALAAWAFARYPFPGREIFFYLVIALLMIPGELTLIPAFLLVKTLGLLNTRWVLILPYVAGGQVFAIFILRSFFQSMPEEMFEASRIDGANELQTFVRIGLPLSQSILGVVAIMHILSTWNDLVWPIVTLSNQSLMTLTIGLYAFRTAWYSIWGPLMAGYVIASIPLIVLFAFTSRLFVEGLSSGAIKM